MATNSIKTLMKSVPTNTIYDLIQHGVVDIKEEIGDDDYYILVVNNPDEGNTNNQPILESDLLNVKSEVIKENVKTNSKTLHANKEIILDRNKKFISDSNRKFVSQIKQSNDQDFEQAIDTYFITNNIANIPDTVIKDEIKIQHSVIATSPLHTHRDQVVKDRDRIIKKPATFINIASSHSHSTHKQLLKERDNNNSVVALSSSSYKSLKQKQSMQEQIQTVTQTIPVTVTSTPLKGKAQNKKKTQRNIHENQNISKVATQSGPVKIEKPVTSTTQTCDSSQEAIRKITDQNLFKMLAEDCTIILEDESMVQCLIDSGQLMVIDEEETQEVVLCDNEESEIVLQYSESNEQQTIEVQDTVLCKNEEEAITPEHLGQNIVVLENGNETISNNIVKEEGTFDCYCGEIFTNEKQFDRHQKKHFYYICTDDSASATPMQKYICECGKLFQDLEDFGNHEHTDTIYQSYSCEKCDKMYKTVKMLSNHMIMHNIVCIAVSKTGKKRRRKRQMRTGSSLLDNNFSCDVCGKTFKSYGGFNQHKLIHSTVKSYVCDVCGKAFVQRNSLRTHSFTHINPVTCSQCDIIFRDTHMFEQHKVHGVCPKKSREELIERFTSYDNSSYACLLCFSDPFTEEHLLEHHMKSTHFIDDSDLSCFACGKTASSKAELQAHVKSHDRRIDYGRARCELCDKVFCSRARLKVHMRVHTNERPFPCQLCERTFKTRTHLQFHNLTHTKEKSFVCSVCDQCFSMKANLLAHQRLHTGEKPYVCPLCEDRYIDSKQLKRHKLTAHPDCNTPWHEYLKVSYARPARLAYLKL